MRQLAATVEQHVAEVQALGFKEGADALHTLALIDEQERYVLMLMLGVLICTLPTAIIFLCLQKSFANGITGAVK